MVSFICHKGILEIQFYARKQVTVVNNTLNALAFLQKSLETISWAWINHRAILVIKHVNSLLRDKLYADTKYFNDHITHKVKHRITLFSQKI